MSAAYRIAEVREKKRKKLKTLRSESSDAGLPMASDMNLANYTNAFNTYLTKLKRADYETKNPKLFCWNQKLMNLNKLNLPQSVLQSPSFKSVFSTPRGGGYDYNEDGIKQDTNTLPKVQQDTSIKVSSHRPKRREVVHKSEDFSSSKLRPAHLKKMLELDLKSLEKLYKASPLHAKTTYPVTKLQMELLTQRSDSINADIPNQQYMLNHFNKRNHSVNKIVSQINANEELLDREQIMKETIAKIEFVSRPYTLHKRLQARSRDEGMHRAMISSRSQNTGRPGESKTSGLDLDPLSKQMQKSGPDPNLQQLNSLVEEEALKAARAKKSKPVKVYGKGGKDPKENKSNAKRESDMRMELEKPQGLLESLKASFLKLEEASAQTDQILLAEEAARNPNKGVLQLTTVQSVPATARVRLPEEEDPTVKMNMKLKNGNFFNYRDYFKKKYMGSGMNMEFSTELRTRIAALNKDLKVSLHKIKSSIENPSEILIK